MIPYVRDITFEYGVCDQVSPMIRRVIARNPGPFTFTGTGTYIVGRGQVAVIDPGPDLPEHLEAILADASGQSDTVELDQAAVGRISRIDAIQRQEMAKAQQRMAARRLGRVNQALIDFDDPDLDTSTAGTFYVDDDGDGYGDPSTGAEACEAASGTVDNDEDCDDRVRAINPDAEEVCDEVDNDCDGDIDPDAEVLGGETPELSDDGRADAMASAAAKTLPPPRRHAGRRAAPGRSEPRPKNEEDPPPSPEISSALVLRST